jgi:hypothetical protein
MSHFRKELIFLAHFIVIYIATTIVVTRVLNIPETSWFILYKNSLSALVLLLFCLKSELFRLVSYFKDTEKVEKRTEVRNPPSKLKKVILSPLHTALRIPVQAINENVRGIMVVAESSIRHIVKKKQLLRVYVNSNFEIYQVVWTKIISGQLRIGLLKVS